MASYAYGTGTDLGKLMTMIVVGYAGVQSGLAAAGLAYGATESELVTVSAFGIGFAGPLGMRPTQLWGLVTGAAEDVQNGCF